MRHTVIVSFVLAHAALVVGCPEVGDDPFPDGSAADVSERDTTDPDGSSPDLGLDANDVPVDASSDVADATTADTAMPGDTTSPDAVDMADMADMVIPGNEGPPRYPATRTHSPLTPAVVAHLRAVRDATAADSLAVGRWKLVRERATGRLALFDLERDPGELRNLARERAKRTRELEARLDALRESSARGTESLELSADEVRALQDLGYLGDELSPADD